MTASEGYSVVSIATSAIQLIEMQKRIEAGSKRNNKLITRMGLCLVSRHRPLRTTFQVIRFLQRSVAYVYACVMHNTNWEQIVNLIQLVQI